MKGNRRKLLGLYWRRLKLENPGRIGKYFVAHPDRVALHLRRLLLGDGRQLSNLYVPSTHRKDELEFCSRILEVPLSTVELLFDELEGERTFLRSLHARYEKLRPDRASAFGVGGRFSIYYVVIRILQPRLVIETGVHDGLSSAMILKALERNGSGLLISIDLPAMDLPFDAEGAGWLVPEELRRRWRLLLGDARALLPQVARRDGPVDIFIQDSDPAEPHREFEFRTVQPFVSAGGLMLTSYDDDRALLDRLAVEWSVACRARFPWHTKRYSGGFRLGGPSIGTNAQPTAVVG